MNQSLLAFILIAVSTSAPASIPENQSGKIDVYKGSATPTTISLNQIKNTITINSKPPHRMLNPEGKISEFEGVRIRDLIHLSSRDSQELVRLVGSDGYISILPAKVILEHDAIIALKQNGTPLTDRQGGYQVILPTEGKGAVSQTYARKAAFWCWYVRSIVVGGFHNSLSTANGLKQFHPKTPSLISFEGPSVFQETKTACPNTQTIPLTTASKSEALLVTQLSGLEKVIDPNRFDLVLAIGHQALPVECGGPFALIEKAKESLPHLLAKDLITNVIHLEAKQ